MKFKLLKEPDLYKEVTTHTDAGEWLAGVYYPNPSATTTYQSFFGDYEPLSSGEKTRLLPAGLQSSSSLWVFSETLLDVATDLGSVNFKAGSIIYLEDPEENPDTVAYDVFDKEDWHKNEGFSLLGGHNTYICIRREKR